MRLLTKLFEKINSKVVSHRTNECWAFDTTTSFNRTKWPKNYLLEVAYEEVEYLNPIFVPL